MTQQLPTGEWAGALRSAPRSLSTHPVWMGVYIHTCKNGAENKSKNKNSEKEKKNRKKKKKQEGKGCAAAAAPSPPPPSSPPPPPSPSAASAAEQLPPRPPPVPLLALRVLPTRDKVARAAAVQGHGLAKRDVDGAHAYIVMTADGLPCAAPLELRDAGGVESDSALVQDGVGIIVVVNGAALPRRAPTFEQLGVGASVLEAMASLAGELAGRTTQVEARRHARTEARKAEEEALSSTQPSRPVLFWKNTDKNGYLSNWAASSFELDGRKFTSGEQYIMWSKATLMGDETRAALIMSTNDPHAQKKLGRLVHPWKPKVWARHMESVQLRAVRAKFGQNPELRARLSRTCPKRLAEASPSDTVYGIGLAPDDPRALDPANWRGANMLGRCLELVRSEAGGVVGESDVAWYGGGGGRRCT